MSHRSQRGHQRQQADRGVFGGMDRARYVPWSHGGTVEHAHRDRPPTARVSSSTGGSGSGTSSSTSSCRHELADEAGHLVRDAHGPNDCSTSPMLVRDEHVGHLDVGDVAGLRVVVGVGARDDRHPLHQVELLHQELLAHVQVDGARVQRGVGAVFVGGAQQLAGRRRSRSSRRGRRPPGRRPRGGGRPCRGRARPPCAATSSRRSVMRSTAFVTSGTSPKNPSSSSRERHLAGGAAQVGLQHVRVRRVDHRRLGRPFEQIVRVIDQVLVERIVLGDEDASDVAVPPPGPSRLLPHRRARARGSR